MIPEPDPLMSSVVKACVVSVPAQRRGHVLALQAGIQGRLPRGGGIVHFFMPQMFTEKIFPLGTA